MRNRFARFMYGRYGVDALNNFLFGLYVALFVLELFFPPYNGRPGDGNTGISYYPALLFPLLFKKYI